MYWGCIGNDGPFKARLNVFGHMRAGEKSLDGASPKWHGQSVGNGQHTHIWMTLGFLHVLQALGKRKLIFWALGLAQASHWEIISWR
jgi:hypothetical protein